jgi:8-amino-7-oxononanoate synthase
VGPPLEFLDAALAELRAAELLRADRCAAKPALLNLCSNDYLGYASLPISSGDRGGAGAARLVYGDDATHHAAEASLASWVGAPAALLFSSGYAANVGTLQALAGPDDVIISDALNHASIIDGCRLSRAKVVVVRHLDVAAVERSLAERSGCGRAFVVTESVFSMDGDRPDLVALREITLRRGAALVVDEAHALGVLGPEGAGACAAAGVMPDVLVGTVGKALGLQGAFVAGSASLRTWLWNRARSFVFSTGVSPAIAGAIPARVARARADDAGRRRLLSFAADVCTAARAGSVPISVDGPVLPWVLGSPRAALLAAAELERDGVLVQAIRPPTVAAGGSRIRLTASARLSEVERNAALEALTRCFRMRFT